MKNLKWVREDKKYLLKNDETTMIDLSVNPSNTSSFVIDNKQYQVFHKGFFSPVYIVQSNEKEILKLSHSFWGSNGKIVFNDGTVYTCDYKNKGGLTMRFMDGDNEILSYGRSIENKNVVPFFSIGIAMVDAEKLLVLAALGFIMVQCLFKEDDASDDASLLLVITAS